jgi:hypothetical protein
MKPRERIQGWLDNWRKPPAVVPIKRTMSDHFRNVVKRVIHYCVVLMLKTILYFAK